MSIKLDESRNISECRGDRTPDDPHYRVCYMQGGLLGKEMVLLPFDANGDLVPDDGKKAPWMGLNSEGKPVQFHPLWNEKMRAYLEKKEKRLAALEAKVASDEPDEDEIQDSLADEINLAGWLRTNKKYDWSLLVAKCKKEYGRIFTSKREMVIELVIDQKILPEHDVHPELSKHLPAMAA